MTLEEYKKGKKEKKVIKVLKSLLVKVLICSCLVMAVLVACNLSEETKMQVKKELFETNINFSFFSKIYSKIFKKEEVSTVSGSIDEYKYEDYYEGAKVFLESEEVKLMQSGIVVFIGEKENYGKTIILQQSNGIDAWYGNMKNINVNLYDYVTKDSVIGTVKDNLYLVFEKDGDFLDYKKYIK